MNEAALNNQVEQAFDSLRQEFAGALPASRVNAVGEAHFYRLRSEARIVDFVPVLVYRYAHEELVAALREELHRSA